MFKKAIFLGVLAIQTLWCMGQDLSGAIESISRKDIERHMRILAGEEMQGRKTGDPGIEKAADYIVSFFDSIGLVNPAPGNDPYILDFPLYRTGWKEYMLIHGNDTVKFDRDLLVQGIVPELSGEYGIVFAGYGIEHPKYNNYKGLDVKGKIVLYLVGEPKDKSGRYVTTGSAISGFSKFDSRKDSIAYEHGAVAAIRLDPAEEQAMKTIRSNAVFSQYGAVSLKPQVSATGRNYVYTTLSQGARIMGISAENLLKAAEVASSGNGKLKPITGQVMVSAIRNPSSIKAENIAGVIEGTDLKDEYIVVTAHYDHLGPGKTGIRYGADDNASGTIGIMEVAEAFQQAAKSGIRPRRSILFLPVTGEEMGLLGSQYYVAHPIVPIDKTIAAVNMDMIGRKDKGHEEGKKYVFLYVSGQPGEFMDMAAQKAFNSMKTDLAPEFQYKSSSKESLGGSDHMSFEAVKVPVAYFFNGTHEDYHKPGDTYDKILYDQMRETVRLVFLTTWELANQEKIK
jgi:Zn-dependent M28 family amino/carboxypeptidase